MPLRRPTPLPHARGPVLVAALVTGALVAVSACSGDTGGGDDQVASRPSRFTPSAPVTGLGTVGLDCASSAEGVPEPPDGYTRVLEAVAVAVPDGGRTLELAPAEGSGGRRFAKQGLVLRTGEGAELSVPSDAAERPAIAWGNILEPVSVITVAPCPDRPESGAWLAFVGGFYAEHPMCVPLTIRTASRETTVHIPLGMPCPG
ncbi:hypothetical protein OG216_08305 [Streptomycetaceae bacterium NBC_01309]